MVMSKNYNKIIKDGEVKLDLSQDSVTEEKLLEGVTAHDRCGNQITGAMKQLSDDTVNLFEASFNFEDQKLYINLIGQLDNSTVQFYVDAPDALPENIVAGKRILDMTGTAEMGIKLPSMDNPASAESILLGKQAINENGDLIIGRMRQIDDDTVTLRDAYFIGTDQKLYIDLEGVLNESRARIIMDVPDALPENIVAGKKILGLIGTANVSAESQDNKVFTCNEVYSTIIGNPNSAPTFQGVALPETFEIYMPFCYKLTSMFGSASSYPLTVRNVKKIIVRCSTQPQSMEAMFGRANPSSIEEITLDFDMSKVAFYRNFFCMDQRNNLKRIEGNIDFSSVQNTDCGLSGFNVSLNGLEYVNFVKNTLSVSSTMVRATYLSDFVLCQIANVLNESVTGKTLTLHETPKARCNSLLGNVSMDETNTFHVFTKDESGDTTLTDFITQVKGWTLA